MFFLNNIVVETFCYTDKAGNERHKNFKFKILLLIKNFCKNLIAVKTNFTGKHLCISSIYSVGCIPCC